MNEYDPFSQFPLRVMVSSEDLSREWIRERDSFAIHGPVPPALTTAVLYSFQDPVINVCRGEFSAGSGLPPDLTVTPIYRLGMNGPQGVPTGKVFIRFKSDVPVEERRRDLRACGFTISEPLSYAPHAAWLHSMGGNIAMVLNEFPKLATLHDVVLVEPQLLMRQGKR